MLAIEILRKINYILLILMALCYAYQAVFAVIAMFIRKKKSDIQPHSHDFAFLICARNEEKVIRDLINSIKNQSYDLGKKDIFVLADNCTDNTALIAEENGAIVYYRESNNHIGKGYALQELKNQIDRDYPGMYDGFFVFDADNILAPRYVEEMNKDISEGKDIVVGYRNTKNFGDNWVTAAYGVMFLRESQFLNYPRDVLGTSCFINGTGYYFSKKVADELGEWPFHLLTEDAEFTIDRITKNQKIYYCRDAEFFDEQPTKFSDSWNQRIRWCKGYWQVFEKYGSELIKGIFSGKFACYDMTMAIMPAFILTTISVFANLALLIVSIITMAGTYGVILSALGFISSLYLTTFVLGAIITFTEWKKIRCSAIKKILYLFTFPVFMLSFCPIAIQSLFCKVEWKHIEHTRSIDTLSNNDI